MVFVGSGGRSLSVDLSYREVVGTLLTFSVGVTELGWSYTGDLSPSSTHNLLARSVRLLQAKKQNNQRIFKSMSTFPKQKKDKCISFLCLTAAACMHRVVTHT